MANDENANSGKFCKIYDRDDVFTIAVQIVLAILALGSLWIKRMREVPKRNFKTWSLDVSKQGIGAGYAHVLNMIIAAVISQNIRGETKLDDQCAWYGMSYIIDTSLGLVIAIVLLRWLDRVANERNWTALKDSGIYAGPDAITHWAAQVIAWLIILSIAKVAIYIFMWAFSNPLAWAGGLLFAPFEDNIHFELVVVMILFPGVLNVVYFWIADGYLRANKEHAAAHEPDAFTDKREALVDEPSTELAEKKQDYSAAPWSALSEKTQAATTAPGEVHV